MRAAPRRGGCCTDARSHLKDPGLSGPDNTEIPTKTVGSSDGGGGGGSPFQPRRKSGIFETPFNFGPFFTRHKGGQCEGGGGGADMWVKVEAGD